MTADSEDDDSADTWSVISEIADVDPLPPDDNWFEEVEPKNTRRVLEGVFRTLDRSKNGVLEKTDIEHGMRDLGLELDDDEIEAMMTLILPGDKAVPITLEVFCNAFGSISDFSASYLLMVWAERALIPESAASDDLIILPPTSLIKESKRKELMRFTAATCVSIVVSRTLTAPLDRLKVVSQIELQMSKDTPSAPTRSVTKALREIYRSEGIRGLFLGNGLNIARLLPTSLISILVFTAIGKHVLDPDRVQPKRRAGVILASSAVATLAAHPLDVVKTRMTLQAVPRHAAAEGVEKYYTSIPHAFRRIWAEEGWRGLYRGIGAGLISIVPYVSVQAYTMGLFMRFTQQHVPTEHRIKALVVGGGVSSLFGQVASHPFDTLRRVMEAQHGPFLAHTNINQADAPQPAMRNIQPVTLNDPYMPSRENPMPRTVFGMFRYIGRTYGYRSLYSGLSVSVYKAVPMAATAMLVREECIKYLKGEMID